MATKLLISQMPGVEIVKKDLIIDVEIDNDKLGEFRMSKGSVDFYTKGAKKKHYRIGWRELSELITEHGVEKK